MRHILLLLAAIYLNCSIAQQRKNDTIPFTLNEHNVMLLEVGINHTDSVQLMLHTAANSINIIEAATPKVPSINWNGGDSVISWGGQHAGRYSQNNSLQIDDLSWDSLLIREDRLSGHGSDGKIGLQLFKQEYIEFNFEQQRLILYTQAPQKIHNWKTASLKEENGFLFLQGSLNLENETEDHFFLIHSGYSRSILLDDAFVAQSSITPQLPIIKNDTLRDSFGNAIITSEAMLQGFNIGPHRLDSIPIAFFNGNIGRQQMSVMGMSVLKQFNFLLDLKEYTFYFEPRI